MKYLSVAEIAKKWSISERSVRNYCARGKIKDVFLTGKTWNISEETQKPTRRNAHNMKYGMPTLIEDKDIQESATRCKELGLSFVEINMNLPTYQTDVIDVDFFNTIALKKGITYTIHADENLNPFDFNYRVAQSYLDTMLDTIKLAKKLAVRIINMHMPRGVYFTMPDKKIYLFEKYRDIFLAKVLKFRNTIEQEMAQTDIKICIENGGFFEDFQRDAIEILLASPCFYLTYDTGHGACNKEFMDRYYSLHKDKLAHMHCHDAAQDNKGNWSNHLPLGSGSLDIEYYLKLAKSLDLSIVLETKTVRGLAQSVEMISLLTNKN